MDGLPWDPNSGRDFVISGKRLPFATEEVTFIPMAPRFGYITPQNGKIQYAFPVNGERVAVTLVAR